MKRYQLILLIAALFAGSYVGNSKAADFDLYQCHFGWISSNNGIAKRVDGSHVYETTLFNTINNDKAMIFTITKENGETVSETCYKN